LYKSQQNYWETLQILNSFRDTDGIRIYFTMVIKYIIALKEILKPCVIKFKTTFMT